jgi:hypothetical protein
LVGGRLGGRWPGKEGGRDLKGGQGAALPICPPLPILNQPQNPRVVDLAGAFSKLPLWSDDSEELREAPTLGLPYASAGSPSWMKGTANGLLGPCTESARPRALHTETVTL